MRTIAIVGGTILAASLVMSHAVAQETDGESILQELQGAVDRVQTVLEESKAQYEATFAQQAATIEALEQELAGQADLLAAANQRISELEASLQEARNEVEAAQARAEEAEASAAALTEEEQNEANILEELQNRVLEEEARARALSTELEAINEALDVALADNETMRTALEDADAGRSVLEAELAEAQTSVDQARSELAQGQQSLEQVANERDALKTQRFWLSILVALALAGLGFLWLRRPGKVT